ncbi:hypothetical protein DMC61_40530 [Amycolatopsis sp. WAC 04169]|uniref:hypothetical protein n=1 Tax=Amycolatopsis sp. WAC 04169 TaxID=2203197 RepID=UPI000F7A3EB4|nr:hypothetical protein [Amycolatopsis sp. WAC 04169]RSN19212.1 hypothetical protein DMC61_40530 [Amycolatopsis sp. WAC 04169]
MSGVLGDTEGSGVAPPPLNMAVRVGRWSTAAGAGKTAAVPSTTRATGSGDVEITDTGGALTEAPGVPCGSAISGVPDRIRGGSGEWKVVSGEDRDKVTVGRLGGGSSARETKIGASACSCDGSSRRRCTGL